MAYDTGGNKFRRKEAVGMELLVKEFIKDNKEPAARISTSSRLTRNQVKRFILCLR